MLQRLKLTFSLLVFLLIQPSLAHAHANLERSSPLQDSELKESPAEIRLQFTEPFDSKLSVATLEDSKGKLIDVKLSAAPDRWFILSVPKLDNGIYKVSWQVLSVDTHVTDGSFRFSIATSIVKDKPSETLSLDSPAEKAVSSENVKPKPNEVEAKEEADKSADPSFGITAASELKVQSLPSSSSEKVPLPATKSTEEMKPDPKPHQPQAVPGNNPNMLQVEEVKPAKDEANIVPATPGLQSGQAQPAEVNPEKIIDESKTVINVPSVEINKLPRLQEAHEHTDHNAHHQSGDWRKSVSYLLRIIEILAAACIAGFLFFRYTLWKEPDKFEPLLFTQRFERRLYATACLVYTLSGAARIGLLAEQLSGLGSRNVAELSLLVASSTIVGMIAWLRPLLLGLLFILAVKPDQYKKPLIAVKWAVSIGLIVTFPLTGHALGDSSVAEAAVSLHLIHMLVSALWMGGLLGIYSETWKPESTIRYEGNLNTLIRRFSTIMLPAILLILLSGAVLTMMRLSAWEELYQSEYGRFILAKAGLLLLIIGIGVVHRKILIPHMNTAGRYPHETATMKSMSRFVFFVQIEIIAALLLFVLAGLLSTTSPPDKKTAHPPIYWHVMGDKAHMSMRVSTDKYPDAAFKLDIWLPTGIGPPKRVDVLLSAKEDNNKKLQVPFRYVSGGPDPYGYEGFDKYIFEADAAMHTGQKDWLMNISITDSKGEVHNYEKILTVQ